MMICADGSNCLSCAQHSMPDMFGSWMSIKMISGWCLGIAFNASSAVAHMQTQRFSGSDLRELRETLANGPVVFDDGNLGHKTSTDRNKKTQGRAVARLAGDLETPSQFLQARAHVGHAIHFLGAEAGRQAAAVVGDGQSHFPGFQSDAQPHFRGAGMADDIGERLP